MTLSQEQMKLVREALKNAAIRHDISDEVMNTLASHGHGGKQGHGHPEEHGQAHGGGNGHGDDHGNGGGHGNGHGHGHGDESGPSLSYAVIRGYAGAFKNAMEELGTGIVTEDWQDEMMLVYMDKSKLNNVMAITPENGYVAGILSVYNNASSDAQVTISLLATDSNLNFVKDGSGNYLGGEQCWKEFNILQNFAAVFK